MIFFITTPYFSLTARVCFTRIIGVAVAALKTSLLYVLLEGDRLCPGGGGPSIADTNGPGGPFIWTLMVRGDHLSQQRT